MSFLVHPIEPISVYVRKEYLYDLEHGHGEFYTWRMDIG